MRRPGRCASRPPPDQHRGALLECPRRALCRSANCTVFVLGATAPILEPDAGLQRLAAAALAAHMEVSSAKLLADELELVHAIRSLMEYRPERVADTARHVAAVTAQALSCDLGVTFLQGARGTVCEIVVRDWHAAPTVEMEAAAQRLFERVRDGAILEQELAQEAGDALGRGTGLVARLALPIGDPARPLGVLIVAHADARPRGFTNLCQRIGRALAEAAELLISQAASRESLSDERDRFAREARTDALTGLPTGTTGTSPWRRRRSGSRVRLAALGGQRRRRPAQGHQPPARRRAGRCPHPGGGAGPALEARATDASPGSAVTSSWSCCRRPTRQVPRSSSTASERRRRLAHGPVRPDAEPVHWCGHGPHARRTRSRGRRADRAMYSPSAAGGARGLIGGPRPRRDTLSARASLVDSACGPAWTTCRPTAAGDLRRVEAAGYDTLWINETSGREPFAVLGGPPSSPAASPWAGHRQHLRTRRGRGPRRGRTVGELSGGRFVLGLGVPPRACRPAARPPVPAALSTMTAYLDAYQAAPYTAPPPAASPPWSSPRCDAAW